MPGANTRCLFLLRCAEQFATAEVKEHIRRNTLPERRFLQSPAFEKSWQVCIFATVKKHIW